MISGQIGINSTDDGDTVAARCCGSASMKLGGNIVSDPQRRIILPNTRALRRTDC